LFKQLFASRQGGIAQCPLPLNTPLPTTYVHCKRCCVYPFAISAEHQICLLCSSRILFLFFFEWAKLHLVLCSFCCTFQTFSQVFICLLVGIFQANVVGHTGFFSTGVQSTEPVHSRTISGNWQN